MRYRRDPSFWERRYQIPHELHPTHKSDANHVLVHRQTERRHIFHLPVGKMEGDRPPVSDRCCYSRICFTVPGWHNEHNITLWYQMLIILLFFLFFLKESAAIRISTCSTISSKPPAPTGCWANIIWSKTTSIGFWWATIWTNGNRPIRT